ncbi:S-layer homology domain-containing protein [Synechocystis sp. PCC 7509]|uniref:S-layer homology domain-containing protein n=1 Tax=Synechocystis sp. PCC 7509 TaxID=927677 RepID=UPI0002AC06C3|nr:S-layer homology domain-containing protein [Synechocystis sp. PCC 7509]
MFHRFTAIISLLVLTLSACANSPTGSNLENLLSADPRLSATENQQSDRNSGLPTDFPLYPNAQLQGTVPPTPTANTATIFTTWVSADPANAVQSFYQNQLLAQNWQIVSQPTPESNALIARQNNLQVTVAIQDSTGTTEFTIEYVRNGDTTQAATPEATVSPVPQSGDENFVGPLPQSNPAPNTGTTTTQVFTDIDKASPQLRSYIEDLAALGVLSLPTTGNKTSSSSLFYPAKTITRREYARLLFAANNQINSSRPALQIREAAKDSQKTFQDVPPSDRDFAAIQGLADAGLIPSALSGDSSAVLFRPNAPLTREQLIVWKVPLDSRQALPNASVESIKDSWGFQDVAKIEPKALRAVFADFQNSDRSNIRRAFGYTTLFQPKKPVTRAEAAAVLWYFGNATEGLSAQEVLQINSTPETTEPSPQ